MKIICATGMRLADMISRTVPCAELKPFGSRWAASTSSNRLRAQKSYWSLRYTRCLVAHAPPDLVRVRVDVDIERVVVEVGDRVGHERSWLGVGRRTAAGRALCFHALRRKAHLCQSAGSAWPLHPSARARWLEHQPVLGPSRAVPRRADRGRRPPRAGGQARRHDGVDVGRVRGIGSRRRRRGRARRGRGRRPFVRRAGGARDRRRPRWPSAPHRVERGVRASRGRVWIGLHATASSRRRRGGRRGRS